MPTTGTPLYQVYLFSRAQIECPKVELGLEGRGSGREKGSEEASNSKSSHLVDESWVGEEF